MWYEVLKVEGNKIVLFYDTKVVLNEPAKTEKEIITNQESNSEEELEPEDEEAELAV